MSPDDDFTNVQISYGPGKTDWNYVDSQGATSAVSHIGRVEYFGERGQRLSFCENPQIECFTDRMRYLFSAIASPRISGADYTMRKFMKKMSLNFYLILRYLFYYSGLKYIWEKIHPRTREIPATFPLWVIGIYIALFGIASNRYENKVEKVENRISALVAQMSSNDLNVFKNAVANVANLQMSKIPFRPDILSPKSVFISFVREAEDDDESFQWLKQIVENHRSKLEGVYLAGINLHGALLHNGNFKDSEL